ncbi:MAG: nucleoside phosphorylase [Bacteroidales bacterium]|jgi:uridine phosphorylase|nr:nucleoside phosphorylase [Bacteroidales bacterium]
MNENFIPVSEMPMGDDGSIYHLHLHPEQIADDIILVGDPGRVPIVSSFFDKVDIKVQNREIVTHTGEFNGKRITVLSTGMGTDNIDIVINELDALVNIDLKTRTRKETHHSLNLVRLGTSGSLQGDYEVNSFCAATHGFGLDGLLNYYEINPELYEKELLEEILNHLQLPLEFARPYIVKCSQELMDKIGFDMIKDMTATAPGFFAPQGRKLRLPLVMPDLPDRLTSFRSGEKRFANLEMETSALYGLGRGLGHNTLTVCVLIANRVNKTFSEDYKPYVAKLTQTVIERLCR